MITRIHALLAFMCPSSAGLTADWCVLTQGLTQELELHHTRFSSARRCSLHSCFEPKSQWTRSTWKREQRVRTWIRLGLRAPKIQDFFVYSKHSFDTLGSIKQLYTVSTNKHMHSMFFPGLRLTTSRFQKQKRGTACLPTRGLGN